MWESSQESDMTEFSDGEAEDCEDRQGSRTIHKSANFVIGWIRCCHQKKRGQICGEVMGMIINRGWDMLNSRNFVDLTGENVQSQLDMKILNSQVSSQERQVEKAADKTGSLNVYKLL